MSWSAPSDLISSHVSVIGTGTLGRRVGLVWATQGGSVELVDNKKEAAEQALEWIQSRLSEQVKAVSGKAGKVTIATNTQESVKNAWMVVECTPEIADLKINLLGQLDSWCAPNTIVATISSSFKSGDLVGKVSEAGKRRVLNTHYFQPPDLPPVEIMSCGKTDPEIIRFLVKELPKIGLDPAVAEKESTGLIYNRIWAAMKRETMMVLAEGVGKPEDIDKLFRYSFQSQGAPCDLMDRVGLQTVCNIEDHYIQERGNIPTYPVDYIRKNYVDKGNLGYQSGKGLFDHHEDSSKAGPQKQSLRHQLIGAWELVEYSAFPSEDPSQKTYPMTEDVQGVIMYTPNGYMSAQLQIPGQPPFAKNDLNGGTKEEYAESGRRYLAYTGPFYLDESQKEPILQHHMTNSSFPNWLGNTQRRLVKISSDGNDQFLTLGPEGETVVAGKKQTSQLVWRRLPDNHAKRPE